MTGVAGRVDIKDLSWEDREKVLRLLFAKINNQVQQMHYSNLPGHPLYSEQQGAAEHGVVYLSSKHQPTQQQDSKQSAQVELCSALEGISTHSGRAALV